LDVVTRQLRVLNKMEKNEKKLKPPSTVEKNADTSSLKEELQNLRSALSELTLALIGLTRLLSKEDAPDAKNDLKSIKERL